jgi:hypothetical protein
MKIRRPLFFAVVAATAVSLASIAVSAVAAETPFKGTANAVETSQGFPIVTVTRNGTGTATYLGKYTSQAILQVNVLATPPTATGTATFTAANGDNLTTTVVGRSTLITPGVLSVVEVYTITGGTGRFADATGTFTGEIIVTQATGVSSGTFSGVIDH